MNVSYIAIRCFNVVVDTEMILTMVALEAVLMVIVAVAAVEAVTVVVVK